MIDMALVPYLPGLLFGTTESLEQRNNTVARYIMQQSTCRGLKLRKDWIGERFVYDRVEATLTE